MRLRRHAQELSTDPKKVIIIQTFPRKSFVLSAILRNFAARVNNYCKASLFAT
jgi:hypothetical protein